MPMTVPAETASLKRFKATAKKVTAASTASRASALKALCEAGILQRSKKTGKYSRRRR